MKILLVNPTLGPEGEYGALASAATELPQLGLASLATSLIHNRFVVRVIDFHLEQLGLNDLMDIAKDYDLIGFSVYITTAETTLNLAKEIKKYSPNIHICVGGPQVTLSPHEFHKDYIDYIFIGEADISMVELAKTLRAGEKINSTIKGLLHLENGILAGNSEVNIVDNISRLPLIELDKLYDLSLFYPPIHIRGKKVVNLLSVRGCPYHCTFCAAAQISGRKLRKVSVTRFVDQIEYYVTKRFDSFMIYDDTFTIDRKRAIEISKEIIKRKLDISWNCWSRVDCVDLETLSYMKDAGCYYIMFGCESLNDHTLKKLKKGFTVEQCFTGIATAKKAGLIVSSSFMIGLPGETREDILNTIKRVNRSRLDTAVYPIFEPYKGTPIYEECKKEGRWVPMKDETQTGGEVNTVWVPDTLTRKEIEKLSRYAFRSFYFRPQFLPSFHQVFSKLPLNRKARLMKAGLDFFLLNRLRMTRKKYQEGARYH